MGLTLSSSARRGTTTMIRKLFCLFSKPIDASSAVLENPLETVKWNLHKSYLLDLDKRGVPIVPTILFEGFTISGLEDTFGKFKTDEIVIKPAVSATAKDTFRITSKELRKN